MSAESFELRDFRKREFFWADNELVDLGILREIGPVSASVLIVLLRFAGQDQECYPSIRKISDLVGLKNKAVIRALRRLEECLLIQKVRSSGRRNVYRLLNSKYWTSPSGDTSIPRDTSPSGDTSTSVPRGTTPVSLEGQVPGSLEALPINCKEKAIKKKEKGSGSPSACSESQASPAPVTVDDVRNALKFLPEKSVRDGLLVNFSDPEKAELIREARLAKPAEVGA